MDDDWDPRVEEWGLPGWMAALFVSPLVVVAVVLALGLLGVIPTNFGPR